MEVTTLIEKIGDMLEQYALNKTIQERVSKEILDHMLHDLQDKVIQIDMRVQNLELRNGR